MSKSQKDKTQINNVVIVHFFLRGSVEDSHRISIGVKREGGIIFHRCLE
jgi:hypothetical protein